MRPLVTIAIPTYNRADSHLREAIESALGQRYERIEIVVSDNCSSDRTEEVVANYDDPRIRYFRQEKNIGHNNNFNFCLEQAKGEYFLLLSDDDMIDDDFVESCLSRGEGRTDFGVIHTGVRIVDAGSRVQWETPNEGREGSIPELTRCWFQDRKAIYLCATLFVTERLREVGAFASKHNLCQDMMAQFRLAARFGWIDVPDVKASVRRHAGEITHTAKIRPSCEDALLLLELICELCPEDEREAIRDEGMRYFARGTYKLALKIPGRGDRLLAQIAVGRVFGWRYFPLWSLLRARAGRFAHRLKGGFAAKTRVPSRSGS